jgi:ubiquinone/menaquinone biosynthesis C-methylase UbiE
MYHKTGLLTYWFNRVFRRALYKRAELAVRECLACRAESVLDVGCGSGVNTVLLARNGIPKVVGLDYAEGMLDLARRSLPAEYEKTVEYRQADFMNYKDDGKYDCVMALGVFDYLDDPRGFLEKMKRKAVKKVLFSVPGKGNLRQIIRKIRYQLKGCPLYFYHKGDLSKLLSFDDASHEIINVGSSAFLCVLSLK